MWVALIFTEFEIYMGGEEGGAQTYFYVELKMKFEEIALKANLEIG